MILEFEVQNYRSIKDKQVFSLVAEASKSKTHNVFDYPLANGDTVRLLKAAVVYGANASGKSNLLQAFKVLREFVLAKLSVNDPIKFYNPFLFDVQSKNKPTTFILTFIGPKHHKYRYEISFNQVEVFQETLDFYPKGKAQNLFKRPVDKSTNDLIHTAKLGQISHHKTLKIFRNQLVMSKFGFDTPDDFFTPIYQYFDRKNLSFLEIDAEKDLNRFRKSAENALMDNKELIPYLSKIIKVADTKIDGITIRESNNSDWVQKIQPNKISIYKQKRYESFGQHAVHDGQEKIGVELLPFNQQSKGSNILFALGTYILYKLKLGGMLIIDEIDTSLHPKLAKFLIQLFQNQTANPKNAQIIFTTHEIAFLDKDLFRKDQIWFTEKNDFGETELFSIQDFDTVREDTPFDKWYMAGKFGGIPDIQALEAIFNHGASD